MRKGAIAGLVVGAILLVGAVAYTVFYVSIGLYRVDFWRSVMLLVALWLLVAAALAYLLYNRTQVREELIRRYYLSHDWVYNHEIGYAPLARVIPNGDPFDFVTFAADALVEMSYGFEVAETPGEFEPEFMVSTTQFRTHRTGDGVVVDTWKGSLHRVVSDAHGQHGSYEIGNFANAAELAHLLKENEAFA